MKKFLVVASLLVATPAMAASLSLTADTWIQGVLFKGGTVLELDDTNTRPVKGTLATEYRSRGLSWAKESEVRLNEKLEVISGVVAPNQSLHLIAIKPGSPVYFDSNGQVTLFTVATDNTGSIAGNYTVLSGSNINVYGNGSARGATVTNDFDYAPSGAGLKSYVFSKGNVAFYPSTLSRTTDSALAAGKIREATLKFNHINSGEVIPAGAVVMLDERGDVIRIDASSPFFYRRIPLSAGGVVEIMPGSNFGVFARQDVTIDGKVYPANQWVFVGALGKVISTPPK